MTGGQQKGRRDAPSGNAPSAFAVGAGIQTDQGIDLIAWASRCLLRAARFLCTTFLSAMRSITDCSARSCLTAAALSPAAMAFFTFLIAVRTADLTLALCLRLTSDCRARLRACAVLAMRILQFLEGQKKTGHNNRFSSPSQPGLPARMPDANLQGTVSARSSNTGR